MPPSAGCHLPADLDLLRHDGLDPRAAARLDVTTYRYPAAGQLSRLDPGRGEDALIALRDGDGEVFRPSPSEIHVDRAAALAHRHDVAFDEREAAELPKHPRRILGTHHFIARNAP